MKQLRLQRAAMLLAITAAMFASCSSSDDDDDNKNNVVTPELSISTDVIELAWDANSENSLTITSNTPWSIKEDIEWLDFSATKGAAGTETITVVALDGNNSDEERIAEFQVTAGGEKLYVDVRQAANPEMGRKIVVAGTFALTDCVAYTFDAGSKISQFCSVLVDSETAATLTDEELVQLTMSEGNTMQEPNSSVIYWNDGLISNQEYCIICFGYDEDGKRSEISKTTFRTKEETDDRASVAISKFSFTSSYWFWNITMSEQTSKYYMVLWDGDNAVEYAQWSNAAIAYIINENLENLTAQTSNGTWRAAREEEAGHAVYIVAWALDKSGELSCEIDEFHKEFSQAGISERNTARSATGTPGITHAASKTEILQMLRSTSGMTLDK